MQTEKQSGTYRRPEPSDIACVVREVRTYLGWKQFALAHEAGVTVRTIERIESGERVSDDTLARIEKALKFQDGAFTKPSYCPSDEELAELVKKTKQDYTHTPLHDLVSARDLDNVFSAHAYLVDGTAVDDALADSVAAVKDYVQDCGDIYNHASHTDQLAYSREALEMIRELEAQGYTARWGRYATADKFNVGVLIFFKTADLQNSEHFRHAVFPRLLMSSLQR